MLDQHNHPTNNCPVTGALDTTAVQTAVEELLRFCQTCEGSFWQFEQQLLLLMAALGRRLIQLFLAARQQRLDLEPYRRDGRYRPGDPAAVRTLKTVYGTVAYPRAYWIAVAGGRGCFPVDVALGLTRDRLSPWVRQWVARLATRLSFASAQRLCRAALGWAPATETIEQVVLGLGRQAAPFLRQLKPPAAAAAGEVLVIEVDGKCPPTATAAELSRRRGRRTAKPAAGGACGCQRHRGQAKRKARGPKKRRKKGDKSKNGKEVMVVVLYTLERGADGKLHGPCHKKLWGSFTGRKAAARWARAEATKWGFGPDTAKTVQIVLDGAKGLKQNLQRLFPQAIITVDVCHVVEKLWSLGHHFHPEGSDGLKAWVEELKGLVYAGQAATVVARLRGWLAQTPLQGPGTKGKRKALTAVIGYLESRLTLMQYDTWRAQDLVLATGQVEGAVRHLVGERFDCAGMRWVQGKAEALLHLRCIELNGDWERFADWVEQQTQRRLQRGESVKILTDRPMTLKKAA